MGKERGVREDWFERLTGFREGDAATVRSLLQVDGASLLSKHNGTRYQIGRLELPLLGELRERVANLKPSGGALRIQAMSGEARAMHRDPEFRRALFQVASQFNLLEMTGPSITPEDGVARYAYDLTQGPACAIAAGAATIYRNYFVPVGAQLGQSRSLQLDALSDLGQALAECTGLDVSELWSMRNGYALATGRGLDAISAVLARLDESGHDALRTKLRIGLHWDVEVTDGDEARRPIVSQAFCSALPVAYGRIDPERWAPFARLVLEAAYEATLLAGVLHAQAGGTNRVLLTRLGGGAFGNTIAWIDEAIERALHIAKDHDLDVRWVAYREADSAMLDLIRRFEARAK